MSESFRFLKNAIPLFREQLAKGKGKARDDKLPKGSAARIEIATRPTELRLRVLNILRRHAVRSGDSGPVLPAGCLNRVKEHVLGDAILKKDLKEIMQIAAHVRDKLSAGDTTALEAMLPFDQKEVLSDNMEYIQAALSIDGFEIIDVGSGEANCDSNGGRKKSKRAARAATLGNPMISIV